MQLRILSILKQFCRLNSPGLCALYLLSCAAWAEPSPTNGTAPSKRSQEFPWMSVASWERAHAEDVLIAGHDQVDVLFLGDSITAGWDWRVWSEHFAPLKAANFAIGGDHTGNVLWRLQHGTIGTINPKLVVLMVGVNNIFHLNETPEQIARGVSSVIAQIQLAWPRSKILLNALLPYEADPASPQRALIAQTNKIIATFGNSNTIFYKDYGPIFLDQHGRITSNMMADYLHPTPQAYALWAKTLAPDISKLLNRH